MIRFQVLHLAVGIETEAAELQQDLARLTARLASPTGATLDLVYRVERMESGYTLRVDGSSWDGLGRGDVFAWLETDLSRRLVQTRERALLHAAVLERGGRAYLFAGCSGCGKTTLTTALLKRGFRFLSDEYAPLSLDELSVEPCSMPLKLLESTVRRVSPGPELELLEHGFLGKGETVRYGIPTPGVMARPGRLPLGGVFFPWNRPELPTQLNRLKPAVAVHQVMGLMLNARLLGERAFTLATELVASVPCHNLVVSDIDEACRLVNALV